MPKAKSKTIASAAKKQAAPKQPAAKAAVAVTQAQTVAPNEEQASVTNRIARTRRQEARVMPPSNPRY